MSPSCVQWDTGRSSSSVISQESRRHLISQFVHSVQNHSFIIEALLSTEAVLSTINSDTVTQHEQAQWLEGKTGDPSLNMSESAH